MIRLAKLPASRAMSSHVAFRALFKSVLISMVAPVILYDLAVPHFAPKSLVPLAISGTPPILWLAYSALKLKALDFLGFFAVENTVVSMVALLLANTEREALVGRAMQNVILAALFLATLALRQPMMLHMGRQLATGNAPEKRAEFDAAASQPGALHAYRMLTLGWTAALLIKAAGAYYLGANFAAKDYLILSPIWDLVSDITLVTCSILYGRAKLGGQAAKERTEGVHVVTL